MKLSCILLFSVNTLTLQKRAEIKWLDCKTLKCTKLKLPMNHLNPSSSEIEIALAKFPAQVQPAEKTVFIDFGSNEESGIEGLMNNCETLNEVFKGKVDFIAFDRRGSGKSFPKVNFPSPLETSEYRSGLFTNGVLGLSTYPTDSQVQDFDQAMYSHIKKTEEKSGDILAYISTANIARDLEYFRKIFELDQLNMIGYNAGGVLALTYANMFPDKVGQIIVENVPNLNAYIGQPLEYF